MLANVTGIGVIPVRIIAVEKGVYIYDTVISIPEDYDKGKIAMDNYNKIMSLGNFGIMNVIYYKDKTTCVSELKLSSMVSYKPNCSIRESSRQLDNGISIDLCSTFPLSYIKEFTWYLLDDIVSLLSLIDFTSHEIDTAIIYEKKIKQIQNLISQNTRSKKKKK